MIGQDLARPQLVVGEAGGLRRGADERDLAQFEQGLDPAEPAGQAVGGEQAGAQAGPPQGEVERVVGGQRDGYEAEPAQRFRKIAATFAVDLAIIVRAHRASGGGRDQDADVVRTHVVRG
ncbi:hypothetical protein [Nannocystis pusilla]|uniref:hypothetical protein n=1 Tax=Nannocystis pusilla TaxID=889268 RepID=UPI003B7B10B4